MKRHALWTVGALSALAAAALVGSPAWPQVKLGSETGTGLVGADVPTQLRAIKADPYRTPAAPACETVPAEIKQINAIVGPDIDTKAEAHKQDLASQGAGVARSLVPYGGVVRHLTGANKKDEEVREAVMAAYARRGFLRGIALDLKCQTAAPAARSKATPAKTR